MPIKTAPLTEAANGAEASPRAPAVRGLTARILGLTIICLLLGEVLIFVPSIARFRLTYLEERIAAAHLATLVPASTTKPVDAALEAALLKHTRALSITVVSDAPELMLGAMVEADRSVDLRNRHVVRLIVDAFETLGRRDDRLIAVRGEPDMAPATLVEIVMPEAPMRAAMLDYAWRIFVLSLILSLIVGGLIFFALQRLIVRPLGAITVRLARFRAAPEDESELAVPSRRSDEIGIVEREISRMQHDLRVALGQKTRLAGLGEAVGKLNHDLRNVLASAILISDRLEDSADPAVRKASPRLTEALERALKLCAATLDFARSRPQPLALQPVGLAQLVDQVAGDLDLPSRGISVQVELARSLSVIGDRDELYRVLMNLCRNAADAMTAGGRLTFTGQRNARRDRFVVQVVDTGDGIPEKVRERLFVPFAATLRPGGSGLGLAIAREIMRRHGGDLSLVSSDDSGTVFALSWPLRAVRGD